jgi:hypothetical protein
LTYDDSSLTGIGDESISLVSFNFLFEGINYTENDDLLATVDFLEGDFLGLNYSGSSPSFPTFTAAFPPFFDASFSYDLSGNSGSGIPTFTPVPESSSVLALLMITGIIFPLRKIIFK